MTGEEAWRIWEKARDLFLEQFPPRIRHKKEKEIGSAERFITERFGSQVWEEFRDARFRAGYNR